MEAYLIGALFCVSALLVFLWARHYLFRRVADFRGSYLSRAGSISGVATVVNAIVSSREILPVHALIVTLLALGSVLFFFASIRAHSGRVPAVALGGGNPEVLTTNGPYAIVRHPVYFAYMLNWFASALLCANLVAVVVLLVMCLLYWYVATDEERQILKTGLAADYEVYQRRVPMLIPLWGFSLNNRIK